MAIDERELVKTFVSPEFMVAHEAAIDSTIDPRETEGFSFVPVNELFAPQPGWLEGTAEKQVRGGSIALRSYHTERATHPVGIYRSSNYNSELNLPKILMTTPLGTGVKGHNQFVAEQMMRAGYDVIVKGVPRYHFGRIKALSLTEDANELLGLTQEVNDQKTVGDIEELFIYGESQAAMKALGAIGLAGEYGFEVTDGLIAAPCYIHAADITNPIKELSRMFSMISSVVEFSLHTTNEDRQQMHGTFSPKDMHHHLAVLPVLASGETGKFLPFIKPNQKLTAQLFGKDPHSSPRRTKAELSAISPNISVDIDYKHGHVDGIMSPEFASLRSAKLYEVARAYSQK